MSLYHHENPFSINVKGEDFGVGYWPGDSRSNMVRVLCMWQEKEWIDVASSAGTRIGEDPFGLR